MSVIKNIIFDLGNVIVDLDINEVYNKAFGKLSGKSVKELHTYYANHLSFFEDFEVGALDNETFIHHLQNTLNQKASARETIDAFNAILDKIPQHKIDLLHQARKYFNVFILSNTNQIHIDWCDAHLRKQYNIPSIRSLVHRAYYSHRIKVRKHEY